MTIRERLERLKGGPIRVRLRNGVTFSGVLFLVDNEEIHLLESKGNPEISHFIQINEIVAITETALK